MIREASVVSGTEFLLHPTVIPHAREEKVSFLRGKGLTTEEIEEAFRRVEQQTGGGAAAAGATPSAAGGAAPGAAAAVPQPTVVYAPQPPPPEPQSSLLSSVLIPVSLALSAGASALYFYKTYVSPEGPFPWENLGGGVPGGLQPPPLFQEPAPLPAPGMPPANTGQAQPLLQPQQAQQQTPAQSQQNQSQGGIQTWSTYGLPGAPGAPGQSQSGSPSPSFAPSSTVASTEPQLKRTLEDQSEVLRELLTSVNTLSSTLKEKESNNGGNNVNIAALVQGLQANADVKAELSAIKTLLLATLVRGNNVSDGNSQNQSTLDMSQVLATLNTASSAAPAITAASQATFSSPSQVEEEKTEQPQEEQTPEQQLMSKRDEGIAKARAALAEMVTQCPADKDDELVAGCGLLMMFLRNLLKEPLNPRYRRVAKTNANFKKSLDPLTGYLQFFDTVGFEERGSQMELKKEWIEDLEKESSSTESAGWAKAIIEDAIANLETVREQRAPQGAKHGSPKSQPVSRKDTPAVSPAPTIAPVPAFAAHEAPVQNPVPPPPSATTVTPSYPLSFAEVAKMHAEGKRPDGIKDIPDKLSSDEPSKSSMKPVPKPWEVNTTPASPSSVSSNSSVQAAPAPFFVPPRAPGFSTGSKVEIVEVEDDADQQ